MSVRFVFPPTDQRMVPCGIKCHDICLSHISSIALLHSYLHITVLQSEVIARNC